MGAFRDFARGLRASLTRPALAALGWTYAACLAVAALFAVLVFQFAMGTVEGTAMAEDLGRGQLAWWVVDLAGTPGAGRSVGLLATAAMLFAPLYLVLAVFASGGVVTSVRRALGLAEPEPFLVASARHAGSMVLVAAIEVIVVGLLALMLLVGQIAAGLGGAGNVLTWLWLAASAFTISTVATVFDYARIRVVAGGTPAFEAMGEALRFVGRAAPSVALLVLLNGLLSLGAAIAAMAAHAAISRQTGAGLAAAVLVGQLGVLARLWTRVVAYASETALSERSVKSV
jgi:hypothetical protein